MKTSRRAFLRLGSAAALTGLISPFVLAGDFRTITLPTTEDESRLLEFVARYGRRVRFVGLGILEKLRFGGSSHVHVLVEVGELDAFAAVVGEFPFNGAYTNGNQFAFQAGEVEFTLENLLPRAFNERRAMLAMRKHIAFAHDALSYDPATNRLWDPLDATGTDKIRSVNRTQGSIEGLEVVLRAAIESSQLNLELNGEFLRWRKRLLSLAGRTKHAGAIADVLLRNLATLANSATPDEVKELLRSGCISSALQQIFGMDVEAVIAAYDKRRASLLGNVPNSAVWVSVLLENEMEGESIDGAATTWFRNGTRFQVLRSRTALTQARELLAA